MTNFWSTWLTVHKIFLQHFQIIYPKHNNSSRIRKHISSENIWTFYIITKSLSYMATCNNYFKTFFSRYGWSYSIQKYRKTKIYWMEIEYLINLCMLDWTFFTDGAIFYFIFITTTTTHNALCCCACCCHVPPIPANITAIQTSLTMSYKHSSVVLHLG